MNASTLKSRPPAEQPGVAVAPHAPGPVDELARQKRAFAAVVSHELRTPTASILGFAELLLSPGLDADRRRQYTEVLHAEAARLARLVEQLDRGDLELPTRSGPERPLLD